MINVLLMMVFPSPFCCRPPLVHELVPAREHPLLILFVNEKRTPEAFPHWKLVVSAGVSLALFEAAGRMKMEAECAMRAEEMGTSGALRIPSWRPVTTSTTQISLSTSPRSA